MEVRGRSNSTNFCYQFVAILVAAYTECIHLFRFDLIRFDSNEYPFFIKWRNQKSNPQLYRLIDGRYGCWIEFCQQSAIPGAGTSNTQYWYWYTLLLFDACQLDDTIVTITCKIADNVEWWYNLLMKNMDGTWYHPKSCNNNVDHIMEKILSVTRKDY